MSEDTAGNSRTIYPLDILHFLSDTSFETTTKKCATLRGKHRGALNLVFTPHADLNEHFPSSTFSTLNQDGTKKEALLVTKRADLFSARI